MRSMSREKAVHHHAAKEAENSMGLLISTECKPEFSFHYKKLAERVVTHVLEEEKFPWDADVSLVLCDDERIRILNQTMRGIDRATDVLSFPMLQYEAPGDFLFSQNYINACKDPETGAVVLGDIVISVDHVRSQAKEYGHSEKREYAFLIVHSMLHLLGYDHMEEEERIQMEARQKELLLQMEIYR